MKSVSWSTRVTAAATSRRSHEARLGTQKNPLAETKVNLDKRACLASSARLYAKSKQMIASGVAVPWHQPAGITTGYHPVGWYSNNPLDHLLYVHGLTAEIQVPTRANLRPFGS